eukprot:TRINITY_DN8858_c0_g1_i2.p2 TRINITY_DN8858_c0_g1~~TRINITY_DN8858_c0_g1_i2.p2  ORF type:complete len:189 (+),score=41.48 TRINITY_DN8858_c0_g1_i2:60-569(+)
MCIRDRKDIQTLKKNPKIKEMNLKPRSLAYFAQPTFFFLFQDLYLGAFIKEMTRNYKKVAAVVGMPHMISLQENFNKIPSEINFKVFLPHEAIIKETDEELVEKHAILEVIFQTKIWSDPILKSSLLFLQRDLSAMSEERTKELHQLFFVKYRMYSTVFSQLAVNDTLR